MARGSGGSAFGAAAFLPARSLVSRAARGLLILLLVPALSGWSVKGTQVARSYYKLSGHDHGELVASIRRNGPKAGSAYGMGIIDFFPRYETQSRHGLCRISRADTGLKISLRLPRWDATPGAPPRIANFASYFVRTIEAHEMQHVRIAERYARQITAGLLGLKPEPSCWSLRAKARELIGRLKKNHAAAQRGFDDRTRKQIRRLI